MKEIINEKQEGNTHTITEQDIADNIRKFIESNHAVWNNKFNTLYVSDAVSKFMVPIHKHTVIRELIPDKEILLTTSIKIDEVYQRCCYYADAYDFDGQFIVCNDNVVLGYNGKWNVIDSDDIVSNLFVNISSDVFLKTYDNLTYEDLEYEYNNSCSILIFR